MPRTVLRDRTKKWAWNFGPLQTGTVNKMAAISDDSDCGRRNTRGKDRVLSNYLIGANATTVFTTGPTGKGASKVSAPFWLGPLIHGRPSSDFALVISEWRNRFSLCLFALQLIIVIGATKVAIEHEPLGQPLWRVSHMRSRFGSRNIGDRRHFGVSGGRLGCRLIEDTYILCGQKRLDIVACVVSRE